MAKYDGSIRINTEISTKSAQIQLAALENRMGKTADKIASLNTKIDSLKEAKIPTQEYQEISAQIEKARHSLDVLLEKQAQMQSEGKTSGAAWDRLSARIAEMRSEIDYAKGELQDLVDTGKAFTLGSDTEEFAKLSQQLQYAENDLAVLNQRHDLLLSKQEKNTAGYKNLGDTAKKSLDKVDAAVRKASDGSFGQLGKTVQGTFSKLGLTAAKVSAGIKEMGERAKLSFSKINKSAKKSSGVLGTIASRVKGLALSLLIFNQISKAFDRVTSAVNDGFSNLYTDNEKFKKSVDELKASILTLKNAFAAAFRPLVDIAIPYIRMATDYMIELLDKAGQFMAAVAGQKTYTKVIRQTADAFKEAKKAAEGYLNPLDEINKYSPKDEESEIKMGVMFEEAPVSSQFKDMAEKFKDTLSKAFTPIREAWEREGQFVIDSWKYGLGEVKKLLADIGRDFLTVWQQAKTIKIFQEILDIIGDIGLVVGHLARQFRDAWNENRTGLHILENLRDIIGVIIHNIRLAADKTVEWADKLNFKPLLQAFERFTESLIPVADALSGVLADFYTEVLLPLGKWTIEKGLPELLDIFTAFNEKVEWEALRENLAEFWRHLEPFAETIGEGLIIFIGRLTDALANFLNSQEFKDFLVMIENWMDSVSPEDVANALEMIAKGLIALKLAVLGFSAIKAITGIFTTLISFFSAIGKLGGMVISGAQLIATGIGNIIAALGGILPALSLVAAAVVGWKIGEWINENLLGVDTPSFFEMMDGIKSSFTDGSWKEALRLWGEDIKSAWTEIWGYVKEDFNKSILGEVLGSFTDGTWREALKLWGNDIYSAFVTLGEQQNEWLNSLKENWSQTWENIKSKIFDVVGSIKSAIESAVEWIKSKWDSIKNSFSIGGGSGDSGQSYSARSYSMRSTASPYAANPAFAALSTAPIPKLATGAVIPANKEFLAVLGDQKHGTNIEAPLDTIMQANEQLLTKAMMQLGMMGGNMTNTPQTVKVQVVLDRKVIGETMVDWVKIQQMSTGKNPFELGFT